MKKIFVSKKIFPVLLLFCILGTTGCASVHPSSGFLHDSESLQKGTFFEQESLAAGASFSTYRKIKINPAELKFFSSEDKISGTDLNRLASRMTAEFKTRLGERYEILEDSESPDAETLVVSPSLIFHKTPVRLLNVITSLLIFFPVTSGSAAFEAALTDGSSGKLLAQVAEKRTGALDIKSLLIGSYMKYTHAEGIFKKWAELLSEFLTAH
ncbi:MAG TPA: DUF3313 family protein [Candidatus Omnitrophota bacterium]|nr:DUF3313 family protein [Candidatus Omnitrophota bacterium]